MQDSQRDKKMKSVNPLHCVASQFNTIILPEKPRLNKCPHCLKTFAKPSGLKAHIFSHTGEKPHKCPVAICGRYFSLLSNLRRHMKIHTKTTTKIQMLTAKNSVAKIRPLLPVGPSSINQMDSASQLDQEQYGHGTVPSNDMAYFHRESVSSVEFSSLPVTPGEDIMIANCTNVWNAKMDTSSPMLTYAPNTSLDTTPRFCLPSDYLHRQITQGILEGEGEHFQTLPVPGFAIAFERPPWSTMLSSDPQLSIDELNYLEDLNNQYILPQRPIYPHDLYPERGPSIL